MSARRIIAYVLALVACSVVPSRAEDPFRLSIQAPPPTLEWPAAATIEYQVQWASNQVVSPWQILTNVTGTGTNITVLDPTPPQSARLYRLGIATPAEDIALETASGALRFLQAILDTNATGTAGLPRNEAKLGELVSANFSSGQEFFVPAQLGTWMTAAILGHALRGTNPAFTAGFTDAELTSHLSANADAISNILANHAFLDGTTGGKAFYQVHSIPSGAAPRADPFQQTVSLLDNVTLAAGMQASSLYIRSRDTNLANRIDALLAQFDFQMWFGNDVGRMFIGGAEDPRSGGVLDRIVTEGRLAPVVGFARGDMSTNAFECVVRSMIANSISSNTPGGVFIQHLPVFGTALEIWSPSPYISGELQTLLGTGTLIPMVAAWEVTRRQLNVAAAGATGVADGLGGFEVFALSPSEVTGAFLDTEVLIPPSAGMEAGAVGSDEALANLVLAFHALKLEGKFHPDYGFPNYLGTGTGLVNEGDPVRGTLEIGQMAVALLNRLLGGDFLDNLLRQDAGWNSAVISYYSLINHLPREGEKFVSATGGSEITRSDACGAKVWHLELGQTATYPLSIGASASLNLRARYSNDDLGVGDDVTVLVDGVAAGGFHAIDTLDWNVFVESPVIPLGTLSAGNHTVALRVDGSDGFGVDVDLLDMFPVP